MFVRFHNDKYSHAQTTIWLYTYEYYLYVIKLVFIAFELTWCATRSAQLHTLRLSALRCCFHSLTLICAFDCNIHCTYVYKFVCIYILNKLALNTLHTTLHIWKFIIFKYIFFNGLSLYDAAALLCFSICCWFCNSFLHYSIQHSVFVAAKQHLSKRSNGNSSSVCCCSSSSRLSHSHWLNANVIKFNKFIYFFV